MIDEKRIHSNLETFSFPRLSGTEGEINAFNLTKKKLEELELDPTVQEFKFSTFYSRVYQKLAFSLAFVLFFIFFLNIESIFFFFAILIIFIILIVSYLITRNPEKINFGKVLFSRNTYVKLIPDSNNLNKVVDYNRNIQENSKNIIFMCHLDSKGQRFHIGTRIRSYRIWVFSAIPTFVIIILKNYISFLKLYALIFYIIAIIPLLINLYATILIILNSTNNYNIIVKFYMVSGYGE